MSNELNELKANLGKLTEVQRRIIYTVLKDMELAGQPWDFLSNEECNTMGEILTAIELIDLGTKNMPCKVKMRKKL